MGRETLWLVVGFAGQLVFTGRFALQWLYSEYKKRSVIPVGFWYLSLVGSALLLAYAIYRQQWPQRCIQITRRYYHQVRLFYRFNCHRVHLWLWV